MSENNATLEVSTIEKGRRGRNQNGKKYTVQVVGKPVYVEKTGELQRISYDHITEEHQDVLIDMANKTGAMHLVLAYGLDKLADVEASEGSSDRRKVRGLLVASSLPTDDDKRLEALVGSVLATHLATDAPYEAIIAGMEALRQK